MESQNINRVIEYVEIIKIFYIKKSIKEGKSIRLPLSPYGILSIASVLIISFLYLI